MAVVAPAALIAGPYSLTWNAVALGIMLGDEGVPTVEQLNHAEEIRSSDAYGEMLIECFHQGFDYFAQFTAMEYKTGTLAVLNPFGTADGYHGTVGANYTALAKALVMTAAAGTPANPSGTGSPLTVTATFSILAPNFNTRMLYGPKHRKMPLRMWLAPYTNAGSNVSYIKT